MSHAAFLHNEVFSALSAELRQHGYAFSVAGGGKHGKIVVTVGDRRESLSFSSSPSDVNATKVAVRDLRRRMREWQGDAPSIPVVTTAPVVASVRIAEFHGSRIETVEVDGTPRVALKPIVEGMGLDWGGQLQRLKRDTVLAEGMCITPIPSRGGVQEAVTIPLSMLNGFLFGVDARRVDPDQRETVLAYQRECYEALAVHWMAQPREDGRLLAISNHLADRLNETERTVDEILRFITAPAGQLVPALDLAGTVTALMIIEMAGVPGKERVRGTSAIVTRRMKDYCLRHSFGAFPTPTHIDPTGRWRFPRAAATEWLVGESQGAEVIRDHVAKRRARAAGAAHLQLVASSGARQ